MLRKVSHRRRGALGQVRHPIPQSGRVPACIKPVDFEDVPTFPLARTVIYDNFCIPFSLPFQSHHYSSTPSREKDKSAGFHQV